MVSEKNNLFILENLYNVRHLGGLKTHSGAVVKNYKYIRGTARGSLEKVEKSFFYDLGVRVIVDLRSSEEIIKTVSPLRNFNDIIYYHVDMLGEYWQVAGTGFKDISDLYLFLLDNSQAKIKEVFDVFIKHEKEGVFYHCTAGKDRTGVISMLLLDLVGVPEAAIIDNYSVSYENNLPAFYNDLPEEYRHFEFSKPEYMKRALVYLKANYQSSENYLKIIGLTGEEISVIKRSLLA